MRVPLQGAASRNFSRFTGRLLLQRCKLLLADFTRLIVLTVYGFVPFIWQFCDLRLVLGHYAVTFSCLELFNFVAKRINGLALEEILFSPFGIVKGVTVQQHDKTLHLHVADLLGKDGKALAFQFAVSHCHVSFLQRIQLGSRYAWTKDFLPC